MMKYESNVSERKRKKYVKCNEEEAEEDDRRENENVKKKI